MSGEMNANLRKWIEIESRMGALRAELKNLSVQKKELSQALIEVMKEKNMGGVDTRETRVFLETKTVPNYNIGKKKLTELLHAFFKEDTQMAEALCQFILDHRGESVKEMLVSEPKNAGV